jgi:hypothetical protein
LTADPSLGGEWRDSGSLSSRGAGFFLSAGGREKSLDPPAGGRYDVYIDNQSGNNKLFLQEIKKNDGSDRAQACPPGGSGEI